VNNSTTNWDLVSAARIYEILEQVIKPDCPDFSIVREGALAKPINEDIFHWIRFVRYKGGVYGFRWGLSLAYVPHEWKDRVSWHRSAKAAVFDLWEQAGEDMDDTGVLAPEHPPLEANLMYGESVFRDEWHMVWEALRNVIWSWLNQIADLADVLRVSEKQAMKHWHGPQHWPPPQLVHAFTLARLGNRNQAMNELGAIVATDGFDPKGNLIRALNKIAV